MPLRFSIIFEVLPLCRLYTKIYWGVCHCSNNLYIIIWHKKYIATMANNTPSHATVPPPADNDPSVDTAPHEQSTNEVDPHPCTDGNINTHGKEPVSDTAVLPMTNKSTAPPPADNNHSVDTASHEQSTNEVDPHPCTDFNINTHGKEPVSDTAVRPMTNKKKTWLTPEIMTMISPHKPTQVSAGQSVDNSVAEKIMHDIFAPKENKTFVWLNKYQLEETVQTVANWLGFTTRNSASLIFCACGTGHQSRSKKGSTVDNEDFYNQGSLVLCDNNNVKKRKRTALSSLGCPFQILVSHAFKEERNFKKEDKQVKVTACNFSHNHPLNKNMLIKAKRTCHQYMIPLEACETVMKMMEDGPVPVTTLRNFLKRFVPSSQVISAAMIFNFRVKCKMLRDKYGSLEAISHDDMQRVFDPSSMETAPEHWDSNPIFSKMFKDAMRESMTIGDNENFDGKLAIVKIMEKVKESQDKDYNYKVYYDEEGRPSGIMHMTPYQVRQYIIYGDVFALDVQAKTKNTFGWVFCGPTGTNNNRKIVNFCHSFVIEESQDFYVFVLRAMSEFSGRPLSSILLIAVDGKLDEDSFRAELPGKTHL
jgi:hypothetical protein